MNFSQRLIMLRKKNCPGLSLRTVSELMGFSSDTLRKYESGYSVPTAGALAAIADYYQVSMDFLWGRV